MSSGGIDKDAGEFGSQELYYLLTSLVVPRPIAWVSSSSLEGRVNLAPFSFFSVVSSAPPIVQFTTTRNSAHWEDGRKDTLRNIEATGEFVINVVSEEVMEAMNLTAADCPPCIGEMDFFGLSPESSVSVRVPRISICKAALECRLRQTLEMGDSTMIFGEIVHLHVCADVLRDGRVDMLRLRPVGRLAGSGYAVVGEERRMVRPTWEKLTAR